MLPRESGSTSSRVTLRSTLVGFLKWWRSMANKEPSGFLQQLRQIAGRMSSGPRGAGLGVKLLLGAGALAYGVKEATYTVEGGQRAIIFNRIGGMQMNTVLAEGCTSESPGSNIPSSTISEPNPERSHPSLEAK
uniref:Prohibitin n=1 Tax=Tetraodon nigroviridis TaxID=99883 RepID=H3CDD4_TETNG